MLIQDPVGRVAQIERGEVAAFAALSSEEPVWLLMLESDEVTAEHGVLLGQTITGRDFVPRWTDVLEALDELLRKGLLHVLHGSRLLSNNSRGLESLRDGDDLYRSLLPRLEELHMVKLVVLTRVGDSVLTVRKDTLQPLGPLDLIELAVTGKSISGSSGTMPGGEEPTGWIDDFALGEAFLDHRKLPLQDVIADPVTYAIGARAIVRALEGLDTEETQKWVLDPQNSIMTWVTDPITSETRPLCYVVFHVAKEVGPQKS
jgi:hypothetical protein